MDKELIMYTRTTGCPYITVAKKVFQKRDVQYREIFVDKDAGAEKRVRGWTGFLPVPTLVVANPGEDVPYEPPAELEAGKSPRGLDRGTMISEPNAGQLNRWLKGHGFID